MDSAGTGRRGVTSAEGYQHKEELTMKKYELTGEITVIRNRDRAWRDVRAILPATEDASGWESYVKTLDECNCRSSLRRAPRSGLRKSST